LRCRWVNCVKIFNQINHNGGLILLTSGVREGQWMKYFGVEAQQPTMPKIEFSPLESWNSGVQWTISSLSEAPTKASDHTNWGIQYLKDLTKGAFPLALTRLNSF
uniref:MICOS complex subunit MIC13 n=1 Tax=Amphiprion percula TaxID=161767 RepID=A0A3P8TUR8_AMPPE